MRALVLTDNTARGELLSEWGLCVLIEACGKKLLLDAGASDVFAKNAEALGESLEDVDFAVLSHAHYDHADGFPAFFAKNATAPLYLRASCGENCYHAYAEGDRYIGIARGFLKQYADRLKRMKGKNTLADGIWLLPHTTKGLDEIGLRESMILKDDCGCETDDFRHEQSLIVRTGEGLVIFNSCSHGGADTIIREVTQAFPDETIAALIGGFHLFNKTEEEIRAFARRVKETGIQRLYTGHCTGEEAFGLLKEELGDILHGLYVGLEIIFKD